MPSTISSGEAKQTWTHLCNQRRKPKKTMSQHRIGPAPREAAMKAADESPDIGTLDSDTEIPLKKTQGNDSEERSKHRVSDVDFRTDAGSRALIIYFSKIAKARGPYKECIDFHFLETILSGNADINATDPHGQTVMHEVARNWHPDVALFCIRKGADINKSDNWGRTPLHLAAAVNYQEMVEFLATSGANIHAKTFREEQTPIHYAAKYNAVNSLKELIARKANLNDRDYKQRTPLHLAAEMAREDTTRHLLETGAPAGVFDDTGNSAISLIIEKIPSVAKEALEQFQIIDHAFRKEYFYLNYLEEDPVKWKKCNSSTDQYGVRIEEDEEEKRQKRHANKNACPVTALAVAVQGREFHVIMHPAMQQLINTKWQLFGRAGAFLAAGIHLSYIMLWTSMAIVLPAKGAYYQSGGLWWRIPLEILSVLLTLYFIIKQIWEAKIFHRDQHDFRTWRCKQINRDLEFCHPRWPQERTFLEAEMNSIRGSAHGYFADTWNILDCTTYLSVLFVIATRIISVASSSEAAIKLHPRAYAVALIFMWLHFMKSCRPFSSLGPFITMLGHVITDTLKFSFLFFEFFIPYLVGFWILFGGELNAKNMRMNDVDSVDWEKFNDLTFSVLQITLNAEFTLSALRSVNNSTALVMVGTYFALSTVLCLNLYIALLSETFNRVYQNAKQNAAMLQAATILQLENALTKERKRKVSEHIQLECAPLTQNLESDKSCPRAEDLWERVARAVRVRLEIFSDFVKFKDSATMEEKFDFQPSSRQFGSTSTFSEMHQLLSDREKELFGVRLEIHELKCTLLQMLGHTNLPPTPSFTPIQSVQGQPRAPVQGKSAILGARRYEGNQITSNQNHRAVRNGRRPHDQYCASDASDDLDPIYEEQKHGEHVRRRGIGASWEHIMSSDSDSLSS